MEKAIYRNDLKFRYILAFTPVVSGNVIGGPFNVLTARQTSQKRLRRLQNLGAQSGRIDVAIRKQPERVDALVKI